ncbi:MAG: histidinol dehydrogenase, partial [Guyparkeria sp.]
MIRRMNARAAGFDRQLDELLDWSGMADARVEGIVRDILADVRKRGDAAVLEHTRRLDRLEVTSAGELELSIERLDQALDAIPADVREALELAAKRLRAYAERQKGESWSYTEDNGNVLGQQVTPLDRVGQYVPGGKAAYPSSVLMNAIPAKVAGVG